MGTSEYPQGASCRALSVAPVTSVRCCAIAPSLREFCSRCSASAASRARPAAARFSRRARFLLCTFQAVAPQRRLLRHAAASVSLGRGVAVLTLHCVAQADVEGKRAQLQHEWRAFEMAKEEMAKDSRYAAGKLQQVRSQNTVLQRQNDAYRSRLQSATQQLECARRESSDAYADHTFDRVVRTLSMSVAGDRVAGADNVEALVFDSDELMDGAGSCRRSSGGDENYSFVSGTGPSLRRGRSGLGGGHRDAQLSSSLPSPPVVAFLAAKLHRATSGDASDDASLDWVPSRADARCVAAA